MMTHDTHPLNWLVQASEELWLDHMPLPWGEPTYPSIAAGKFGRWTVQHIPTPSVPLIRGYFRGLQLHTQPNTVLLDEHGDVWMALTPMETESQLPHIASARGHVVVVGAGLGFYLVNVLDKPEVTEVTLIEQDQDVLDVLHTSLDGTGYWLDNRKLSTIHMDVFDLPHWTEPVDYLYVDIWQILGSERALTDTHRLVELFKPVGVGYWGMELDFVHWAHAQGLKPPPTEEQWGRWIEWTGMPIRPKTGHAWWALKAVQNVNLY